MLLKNKIQDLLKNNIYWTPYLAKVKKQGEKENSIERKKKKQNKGE